MWDGWNLQQRSQTSGGADETVELHSLGRGIRFWTYKPQAGSEPAERLMQELAFDATGEHLARGTLPMAESYRGDHGAAVLLYEEPDRGHPDAQGHHGAAE